MQKKYLDFCLKPLQRVKFKAAGRAEPQCTKKYMRTRAPRQQRNLPMKLVLRRSLLMMMSLVLSSCASIKYGELADVSASKDKVLARDAANRIAQIKIPARTTFKVYQKTDSVFGQTLVEMLRRQGYGVQEDVKSPVQANLKYVVDRLSGNQRIRVSVFIGRDELSRAYAFAGNKLVPEGAWSHKE